jgi:2-polyprenyl-6-methoxyphenol hydroxylase-like FAD-dependent oxidoreductase
MESVRARFVVGCDGARSTVRRCLGRVLDGDSANQAWGVMDVLAITDFPDIRLKAALHSADAGNILIIPREGGYLVRLYIELDKLGENERIADRAVTADHLVAVATRILHPYTLVVKEITKSAKGCAIRLMTWRNRVSQAAPLRCLSPVTPAIRIARRPGKA